MGIEVRRTQNGEIVRTTWYCRIQIDGFRTSYALGVPVKGKLPASWIPDAKVWPMEDKGDVWFEKSRDDAQAAYKLLRANPPSYRTNDLSEEFRKTWKAQKRRKYKAVKIKDVLKLYDKHFPVTKSEGGEAYAKWKRGVVERFVIWWSATGHKAMAPLFSVTSDDAQAFLDDLAKESSTGKRIGSNTLGRIRTRLSSVFATLCPYAKPNPFDIKIKSDKEEKVVHRNALTEDEMELVLKTAQSFDPLMYDLIVTGLSTALRKKDICNIQWSAVTDDDWIFNGEKKTGSVRVKTSKTGETVNIPIFPLFKLVLDRRLTERAKGEKRIFPEAAALYKSSPDILTRRLKRVFVAALAEKKGATVEEVHDVPSISAKEALGIMQKEIETAKVTETVRQNIKRCLPLYADGNTFRQINKLTGISLSSINLALKSAEKIVGGRFVAPGTHEIARKRIGYGDLVRKVTQTERSIGKKAGSVYDFPCLRTSFITQAARNNVPLEIVRTVTGHTDTHMLEQYYDRATAVDHAPTLVQAMPSMLMADLPNHSTSAIAATGNLMIPSNEGRGKAIEQLKAFLTGKALTGKEKKKLMAAMLASEDE